MTKIRILHNISQDGMMTGLNRVFDPTAEHHVREAETAAERHPLVPVFEYEVPDDSAVDVNRQLEEAFRLFNVGDDPDFGVPDRTALAYRSRKLRSLSVGDVVQVGDTAHACESRGWAPVEKESMLVIDGDLDGGLADRLIRGRYQFKPGEPLRITVPLPSPAAELAGQDSPDAELGLG